MIGSNRGSFDQSSFQGGSSDHRSMMSQVTEDLRELSKEEQKSNDAIVNQLRDNDRADQRRFNDQSSLVMRAKIEEPGDFFEPLKKVFSSVTMSTRVRNFKNDLFYPVRDFFDQNLRLDRKLSQIAEIRTVDHLKTIGDRVSALGTAVKTTFMSAIKDSYLRFTKAPIFTTLKTLFNVGVKPVLSGIKTFLFGSGQKEKSTTEAVKDQTQFLRTGFIKDQSSFLGRFMERGLLKSLGSGAITALTGAGRGMSQRAEEKKAQGETLNWLEKFSQKTFNQFDRLDVNQRDDGESIYQTSLLQDVKKKIGVGNKSNHSNLQNLLSFISTGQFKQEQHDQKMLGMTGELIEHGQTANEQRHDHEHYRRLRENREGGGGTTSAAMGGLIGSLIGFTTGTLLPMVKQFGAWMVTNGVRMLITAPLAKVVGAGVLVGVMSKYFLMPIVDWFDDKFQTEIGDTIRRAFSWLGERFADLGWWLSAKLSKVPVIGRFFSERPEDVVPLQSQKRLPDGTRNPMYNPEAGAEVIRDREEKANKPGWFDNTMRGVQGALAHNFNFLAMGLENMGEFIWDNTKKGVSSMFMPTSPDQIRKNLEASGVEQNLFKGIGDLFNRSLSDDDRANIDKMMGQSSFNRLQETADRLNEERRERDELAETMKEANRIAEMSTTEMILEMRSMKEASMETNRSMLQSLQDIVNTTMQTAVNTVQKPDDGSKKKSDLEVVDTSRSRQ